MSRATMRPQIAELQYRVVKVLGTGAGSTILLISDNQTGDLYALKVVKRQGAEDDIYVAQARHEYEVLQRLRHSTIVKAYDCRTRRSWFRPSGVDLLMEYVDGRTLDEVEAPEVGQLVLMFIRVIDGMLHMHRRGIYHGDLKPSNLMLTRAGDVKIIDFGTAWIRGQEKDRIQGTPQYMAPEQVVEKTVDERTDIYNLGATMYRMFTGHYVSLGLPQGANGGLADLVGVGGPVRGKPRTPLDLNPNLHGTLSEAIMACIEVSPDRRPGLFEVRPRLVAVAKYLGLKPADLKGAQGDED